MTVTPYFREVIKPDIGIRVRRTMLWDGSTDVDKVNSLEICSDDGRVSMPKPDKPLGSDLDPLASKESILVIP